VDGITLGDGDHAAISANDGDSCQRSSPVGVVDHFLRNFSFDGSKPGGS
jgi:hypothetical protein